VPSRVTEPVPPKGHPIHKRREPLWDRVDSNRVKLAAYVVLFVLAVVLVVDVALFVFGGCALVFMMARSGAWGLFETVFGRGPVGPMSYLSLIVGLCALAWALVTLSRSEKWLITRFGAQLVPKGELVDTKMALKDMAIAAGLPISPALHIIENSTVNAFVFSAHRRRAVLGVTRGFVNKLDIAEQRAVFANLVARLARGDTIVDTGVASLLWPLNAWRDRKLEDQNEEMDRQFSDQGDDPAVSGPLLVFGFALAIVGEVFAFGQRHRQLRAAEKGDAEGMLLLKEPTAMLSALEKAVRYDNVVPGAGDTFSDLFYCWTGDSTNDENDPEWERVARLREVLGVEGVV
jgi:Zn-dependent protease with chaperone function